MSQGKQVVVRLQALDGTWEVCGVDRLRGIAPDVGPMVTGPWGPDTAGFDLRRDPKAIWPDLRTWTACEIEIGGMVVWDGYVKATPSRDGVDQVMSVQCLGWQYHLDEDLYRRAYVHDKLTDWKDARSVRTQDLTAYATAGSVQSGEGSILLGWPKGADVAADARVGVTLDLGPGPADVAAGASILTQGVTGQPGSSPAVYLFVRGHASAAEAGSASYADLVSGGNPLSVLDTNPNAIRGAFGQAYRYVTIFLYAATGGAFAGDCSLQIQHARIFTDDNFRIPGGDTSVLHAPVVIADGLDRATVHLSDDRSRIDPGATIGFGIPAMPGASRTPREAWEGVNAYHDYRSQIAIGRIPVYEPRPSVAEIEVGNWSAMEADGITPQNDEQIYNHAIVTYTATDGTLCEVQCFADGQLDRLGVDQVANPSADVNATGWTPLLGTLTRDTGTYDSPPASFSVAAAAGGSGAAQSATVSQPIIKGRRYRLTVRIRRTAALTGNLTIAVPGAAGTVRVLLGDELAAVPTGSFTPINLDWIAKADAASYAVLISGFGPGAGAVDLLWFDTVELGRVVATLVDRQGFVRTEELQVRVPLPSDGIAAAMIGDAFLRAHGRTAFKGPVKLTGDHSVRHVLTGVPIPLERLGFYTHKLLRFSDRLDPDTGAHGRDAQIEQVTYDPKTNEATVTLDQQRAGFEALMERLYVVTGGDR